MGLCFARQWRLVGMLFLLGFGASVHAALVGPDFKLSPDIQLDSLSLGAGTQNYLAVWRDLSGGVAMARIQGALIGNTGVVAPAFPISDAAGSPDSGPVQRSRVAFDGVNFLTVWADNRSGGMGVRGALVSQQGAVLGTDFLIAPAQNASGLAPQVLMTASNYIVAWSDAPQSGNGTQIFFTRVASDGTHGTVFAIPAAGGRDAAQALQFLLKGPGGEALIVYQDSGATPVETRAVRVDATGAISSANTSGTLMFVNDFSNTGAGAPIGGAFLNEQYMLLTSRGAQIDSTVGRAWLRFDGSVGLATEPLAIVAQGGTGLAEDNFPRAFFNGADGTGGSALANAEFIFPRNLRVGDVNYHMAMKRVNADGTDRDPNVAILDSAASGVLNGAVAAAIGTQYLVAWMDGRRRVADPPQQTNVFGVLIDGTQTGNEARPFIHPSPLAAPLVGIAPLTVTFGFGLSTGQVDSAQWNFGDGSAIDNKSATTHIYASPGTYVAVYSLLKAGLNYNNFLRVFVQSGDPGGAGGPPQTVGGVPLAAGPGINTKVFSDTLTATLDFTKTKNDSFRLTGTFDVSSFPLYTPGQLFRARIGSNTYTAVVSTTNAVTYTASDGATPVFTVNSATGIFAFSGTLGSLADSFAVAGAQNATVSKISVSIPVSISFGGLSTTEIITGIYTATAGKSGKFSYIGGTNGFTSDGYLHLFNGTASETLTHGKTGDPQHDFIATGVFRRLGAPDIAPAATGVWHVALGNYAQDLPTSSLTLTGDVYNFKPSGVTSGIKSFSYNRKTGAFLLTAKALPASGLSATGMPPISTLTLRADLALSLQLDLNDGTKFQAGGYLRLKRASAKKTKWTIR